MASKEVLRILERIRKIRDWSVSDRIYDGYGLEGVEKEGHRTTRVSITLHPESCILIIIRIETYHPITLLGALFGNSTTGTSIDLHFEKNYHFDQLTPLEKEDAVLIELFFNQISEPLRKKVADEKQQQEKNLEEKRKRDLKKFLGE